MSKGYPTYSASAKKGASGIGRVARVFDETFGWLFKQTHQEHDFGIDAQVEVVSESGSVTGQLLGMQVKYGSSFFQEKNKFGYVFRGEQKHFNYFANYPIPILIILCHPNSEDCYWVEFVADETTPTTNGWKITVPLANKLSESQAKILNLLPPPKNYFKELEEYWSLNSVLMDHDHFHCIIAREQVKDLDTSDVRGFIDRLRRSKELSRHAQGRVQFSFFGYEADAREIYEIPELRSYVGVFLKAIPEFFYFVYTGPGNTLGVIGMCLADIDCVTKPNESGGKNYVSFRTAKLGALLNSHFPGLNEMAEWTGLPLEENERISDAITNIFLGQSVEDDA